MASATILHVGDDYNYRIPVMEKSGLFVVRTEESATGIEKAFAEYEDFDGFAFSSSFRPPAEPIISTVRRRSSGCVILFRNPAIDCEEGLFDVVIPSNTSPDIWIRNLREVLQQSRRIREASALLRQSAQDVRSETQRLLATVGETLDRKTP